MSKFPSCFQLILFNPIGRVNREAPTRSIISSFQLILFNPIGRETAIHEKPRRDFCFQLILFNPIGREFVSETLSHKGFRSQIDVPLNPIIDQLSYLSIDQPKIQSGQGIDTV